ncbi:hypothetical protein MUK42_10696 [Musa troglodytarum]|uniref:Uncharacterized protein n=1 Tax=Musa troglodytarum TaxID=320322 RepID=A0A9E7GG99_9LILI|nr:hypothetical protein MUK42_10696 [Musa troglodytarum]
MMANTLLTAAFECVIGVSGCRRSVNRRRSRGSGSGHSRPPSWPPEHTTWRRWRSRGSLRTSTSRNWLPVYPVRPPLQRRTSKLRRRWLPPPRSAITAPGHARAHTNPSCHHPVLLLL